MHVKLLAAPRLLHLLQVAFDLVLLGRRVTDLGDHFHLILQAQVGDALLHSQRRVGNEFEWHVFRDSLLVMLTHAYHSLEWLEVIHRLLQVADDGP